LRSCKDNACITALASKFGVFTQEAVSRMDRVAPSLPCYGDDLLAIEVGGSASATQRAGLVGLAGMEGLRIVFRKNRNRPDAQLSGRAHYADGDLTAIRD
jgi:hypothetical protein